MVKWKIPSDADLMKVAIADLKNSSISLKDRQRALQELLILFEPLDNANDGWLPGVMPRWCYQTLWTDYKVVPQNKPKTLIKIWRPLIKANLFGDKLHSWKALELYHLLSYHFPETSFFIEIFVFKANWKANIGSLCLKPRKISEAIAGWFEVINLAYIAAFKFSKATQKNIGYF